MKSCLAFTMLLACAATSFAQAGGNPQLQRMMNTVAGMRSDLDSANDRIVQLNARIESLEDQLQERDRRLRQLEEQLAAMATAMQDASRQVDSRFARLQKGLEADQRQRQAEIAGLSRDIRNTMRQQQPPAPSGEYIELPVQPGDTLGKIARAAGVSMQSIMDLNGMKDADHLRVGQKLKIPVKK